MLARESQPTPLAAHLPRFKLRHVTAAPDFALLAGFRQRVFRERRSVNFDEVLEARRDRAGHAFVLFDAGAPVAVGRVLPYPSALSSLPEQRRLARATAADSEIGRVACLASPDAAPYSLALLTLGSLWLLAYTRLRRYVGYCHPKLVPLYRRLGAALGDEIRIPGRSDAHRVISGSYEDAATLGGRLLDLGVPNARIPR